MTGAEVACRTARAQRVLLHCSTSRMIFHLNNIVSSFELGRYTLTFSFGHVHAPQREKRDCCFLPSFLPSPLLGLARLADFLAPPTLPSSVSLWLAWTPQTVRETAVTRPGSALPSVSPSPSAVVGSAEGAGRRCRHGDLRGFRATAAPEVARCPGSEGDGRSNP